MGGESRSCEFCVTANWRLSESVRNFGDRLAKSVSTCPFGARSFGLVHIPIRAFSRASDRYELRQEGGQPHSSSFLRSFAEARRKDKEEWKTSTTSW